MDFAFKLKTRVYYLRVLSTLLKESLLQFQNSSNFSTRNDRALPYSRLNNKKIQLPSVSFFNFFFFISPQTFLPNAVLCYGIRITHPMLILRFSFKRILRALIFCKQQINTIQLFVHVPFFLSFRYFVHLPCLFHFFSSFFFAITEWNFYVHVNWKKVNIVENTFSFLVREEKWWKNIVTEQNNSWKRAFYGNKETRHEDKETKKIWMKRNEKLMKNHK